VRDKVEEHGERVDQLLQELALDKKSEEGTKDEGV
jgi:hypothetical protein